MDTNFDFWEHVLNSQYSMFIIDSETVITTTYVLSKSH